jgi:hypothetical protein
MVEAHWKRFEQGWIFEPIIFTRPTTVIQPYQHLTTFGSLCSSDTSVANECSMSYTLPSELIGNAT